jgi:Fe2+ or Zn2+ uptake regulation protein
MSTGFSKIIDEDQRLVILRALAQDTDYSLNEYVLVMVLKTFGHGVSQDKIRTHLAWLAEQNLLHVDNSAGVHVAKLTNRGLSVAQGDITVPGVKRPLPGE